MKVLVDVRAIFQETHALCPLNFHYTFCRRTLIISAETYCFKDHSFEMCWTYHLRIWKAHRDKDNNLSVAERASVRELDRHHFKIKLSGCALSHWDRGYFPGCSVCALACGKGSRAILLHQISSSGLFQCYFLLFPKLGTAIQPV